MDNIITIESETGAAGKQKVFLDRDRHLAFCGISGSPESKNCRNRCMTLVESCLVFVSEVGGGGNDLPRCGVDRNP